jgi:hypothetical protein
MLTAAGMVADIPRPDAGRGAGRGGHEPAGRDLGPLFPAEQQRIVQLLVDKSQCFSG